MSLKEKIRRIKEKREENNPDSMTEEQRLQHEKYLAELTAENRRTVSKICIILWCGAMIGWAIFIVLDILFPAGPIKLMFHVIGAVVTALLALPRVLRWFEARKEKDDEDAQA